MKNASIRFSWLLAFAAFLLAAAPRAEAACISLTVNDASDADHVGCGLANCTLRDAINSAESGCAGDITFDPSVTGSITLTSALPDITGSYNIVGPGAGALTIDADQVDRIFNLVGTQQSVEISGLTLTNGQVLGNYPSGLGGAIYVGATNSLLLSDSVLSNNQASQLGGAIFGDQLSVVELRSVTLLGNQAIIGGAIENYKGSLRLEDCIVGTMNPGEGNLAVGNSSQGGGIATIAGDLSITRSSIAGNSAEGLVQNAGGGILINNGNTAKTVVIENSTISGNSALHGGGGGVMNDASLSISNSTLSANSSAMYGGAIRNGGTEMSLSNVTLSGNSAAFGGGGLYIESGSNSINNATITLNSTEGDGGGLHQYSFGTVLEIQNSILSGNSAQQSGPDCFGEFDSKGYNLLADDEGCAVGGATEHDLVGEDAQLGPLQDNGGPTYTHALSADSPALNAGNPAAPGSGGYACAANDQRGVSRPQGSACDMGAFEFSPALIQWSAASYSAQETDDQLVVTVYRMSGNDGDVTVDYATQDGSAKAGVNYVAASGTLTFEAGETSKTIALDILDDGEENAGDPAFSISLSEATGGASLGNPSSAAILLAQNPNSPSKAPSDLSGGGIGCGSSLLPTAPALPWTLLLPAFSLACLAGKRQSRKA